MSITKKDVQYVASLARLQFSDSEADIFTEQLGRILEYFEKLKDADTEGIAPSTHVLEMKNAFRKDEVKQSLPVKEALRNAPEQEQSYFKVPKIIEV